MYTLILIATLFIHPSPAFEAFLEASDNFFGQYVNEGRVNYKAVHDQPEKIKMLYDYIGKADLSGLSASEIKAFYINAYNLIVIYQVSKYYPLKSPMDASGFFDQVKHKVAGEMLTLNALEIKKLLMEFKDARIHFALACAARSCPELASFAYMPGELDEQLDKRTRKSINDPDWLKVNNQKNEIEVSKIFKWYEKDFVENAGSALSFINKYRDNRIPPHFSLSYYEYNWALND